MTDKEAISCGYDTLRKLGVTSVLSLSDCREVGRYGIESLASRVWDVDNFGNAIIISEQRTIEKIVADLNRTENTKVYQDKLCRMQMDAFLKKEVH